MATEVFNEAAGDLAANGATFRPDGDDVVVQYVSTLDTDADFNVQATRSGDADFSESVTVDTTTVSAGTTASVEVAGQWDLIRVRVDNTAATTGSAVAYVNERKVSR